MTNREYIQSLPDDEFACAIHKVREIVSWSYTDSLKGTYLWLKADYDAENYVWEPLRWYRKYCERCDDK